MKIALLGYGKMGREIESIALERGHELVLKIQKENLDDLNASAMQNVEVAIDFSIPNAAADNILLCFRSNVPVVVGTTGWYDRLEEIRTKAMEQEQALLYATNFSVGVNLFFALNKKLASVMNRFPEYEATTREIHHTEKLDSPSGTSITLAEDLIDELDAKTKWVNHDEAAANELTIQSDRIPDVPGTHQIKYSSEIDEIEIQHTAKSRKGFALGSVIAAEWLLGKKGIYTMSDVLNVNFS